MGMLLLVMLGPAVADDATAPVRIAVVNFSTLMSESPQSKAATAKLKADFVPRDEKLKTEEKTIVQLEEELKSLSDAVSEEERVKRERELRDRQRKYSREMEDYREEVRAARDQALDDLQNTIVQAIGEVREREQIDIVLRETNYIVASIRIDITAKVMQHLEAKFQQQSATVPADAEKKEFKHKVT